MSSEAKQFFGSIPFPGRTEGFKEHELNQIARLVEEHRTVLDAWHDYFDKNAGRKCRTSHCLMKLIVDLADVSVFLSLVSSFNPRFTRTQNSSWVMDTQLSGLI